MNKRSLIVAVHATVLLLAVLLSAGTAAAAKTHTTESDPKDMESSLAAPDKSETPALPPIDAAAPSSVETATFGLG